jgi:DNA-binding MarR family transcriptional regulator
VAEQTKSQIAADAWGSLLRVHADLVPKMDAALKAGAALPLAWYDILLELHSAEERALTMGDLAERVVLSRTRVSRLVDEMTRAGLVSKRTNPADKRSAYAVLTDAGVGRFRDAAPVYLAAIDHHVAGPLSKPELEALRNLLERLVERARR